MERQATSELVNNHQATALYDLAYAASNEPDRRQWLTGPLPQEDQWVNIVSTSSPGPQIPIFLAGHELLSWYPMGPLSADLDLHVAILSYNRKVTIGLTVDPMLVPDVWQLAEYIEESYRQLFAAALGTRRPQRTNLDFEPWTIEVFPSAPRPTSTAI